MTIIPHIPGIVPLGLATARAVLAWGLNRRLAPRRELPGLSASLAEIGA